MADNRRIVAAVDRAWWEARERLWGGVLFWLAFAIVFALLSWWRGLPASTVLILTIITLAILLGGVFACCLLPVVRRPGQNRSWVREREVVMPQAEQHVLFLTIEPTRAMYVGLNKCEVTSPDGTVAEEQITGPATPQAFRRLFAYYPLNFPDAPPLTPGTYGVRWLLGTSIRRWHEILSYNVEVDSNMEVARRAET